MEGKRHFTVGLPVSGGSIEGMGGGLTARLPQHNAGRLLSYTPLMTYDCSMALFYLARSSMHSAPFRGSAKVYK
jgi:hypothetical protein